MTNFVEFISGDNVDNGDIELINIRNIQFIKKRYGDNSMSLITMYNGDFYYVKHTYDEVLSMISQCGVCIIRLKN